MEPIAFGRNWNDKLHYDIVISGKSFPLGSQVPIAFKLTPLAKVQCNKIKVLVTENIEYFCSKKQVHRIEPTRKVQLFEKRSDNELTSNFPGSTMRIRGGGGISYDAVAQAARGECVTSTDTTNLLGNLEDGTNVGPTELEINVQLPSCHTMEGKGRHQPLHFNTTYTRIQVHHWIKIIMGVSQFDTNDPSKLHHFEISVDSPFHILSCRASQSNASLPAYTSRGSSNNVAHLYDCGCPDAARRRKPLTLYPALNVVNAAESPGRNNPPDLPPLPFPSAFHFDGHLADSRPRQMHMLRAPSSNPPAFEAEPPPPALMTPPPQYNDIASPTDGLADYFARLNDAYSQDDGGDESHCDGRVNIPFTPGARISRGRDSQAELGACRTLTTA